MFYSATQGQYYNSFYFVTDWPAGQNKLERLRP